VMLAAAVLVAAGCGTTPGREERLDMTFEAVASPDGTLLAASTLYDEVALFERDPLKFAAMLTRPSDRHVWRSNDPAPRPFPALSSPLLAFTPDGRTLVAVGIAGQLVAWDVPSRSEKFRVKGGAGIHDIATVPGRQSFLTAGPDVVVWSANDGTREGELPLPAGTQAMSVAVSPDGRIALVGLSDGSIAVFDMASRRPLRVLTGHARPVYDIAFAPDGLMFASTAGRYDPRLWKADPKGEFTTGERAAVGAASAAQASQGQAQAFGALLWILGTVAGARVVGAPTMGAPPVGSFAAARIAQAPHELPEPGTCPPHVAFSPDGRTLAATGSFPGVGQGSLVELGLQLFRIDLSTGETVNASNGGCSISFTPDGRFIIVASGLEGAPVFRKVETLEWVNQAVRP